MPRKKQSSIFSDESFIGSPTLDEVRRRTKAQGVGEGVSREGGLSAFGREILQRKAYEDLLFGVEEPRQAGEMETYIDPVEAVNQFKNEEYGPKATGVPYIFTGGSPFPESDDQAKAQRLAAMNALFSNMQNSMAGNRNALMSRMRRGGQMGGQGGQGGTNPWLEMFLRRRQGGM